MKLILKKSLSYKGMLLNICDREALQDFQGLGLISSEPRSGDGNAIKYLK
jgi:hypothetical protein